MTKTWLKGRIWRERERKPLRLSVSAPCRFSLLATRRASFECTRYSLCVLGPSWGSQGRRKMPLELCTCITCLVPSSLCACNNIICTGSARSRTHVYNVRGVLYIRRVEYMLNTVESGLQREAPAHRPTLTIIGLGSWQCARNSLQLSRNTDRINLHWANFCWCYFCVHHSTGETGISEFYVQHIQYKLLKLEKNMQFKHFNCQYLFFYGRFHSMKQFIQKAWHGMHLFCCGRNNLDQLLRAISN